MCRSAIGFDTTDKIALESFDLTSAAAAAVPLKVLSALNTGHLHGSKFTEYLARDVFHRGGAAACLTGEILFLQNFSCRIAIRAILVKAVADLRVQETVRSNLDQVSAVTAAEPDDLSVKALRSLLDRYQMAKSLVADILYFSSAAFHFFIPCHCRHTLILNPF